MKKERHLRWLVPVLAVTVLLAIILTGVENNIKARLISGKQKQIALYATQRLYDLEVDASNVLAMLSVSESVVARYRLGADKDDLCGLISGIKKNPSVNEAYICNSEGIGYNAEGRSESIKEKRYFSNLTREFSGGGFGMIPKEETDGNMAEMVLVRAVEFADATPGYVIAETRVMPFKDRDNELLSHMRSTVVDLDGTMINSDKMVDTEVSNGGILWPYLPANAPVDALKQSLVQKTEYESEIRGYGYVVSVPFKNILGGAICLVSYDDMDDLLRDDMRGVIRSKWLVLSCMLFLCFLLFLFQVVGDYLHNRAKNDAKADVDEFTGLLNLTGCVREMEEYMSVARMKGLLFLVEIVGGDEVRKTQGLEAADSGILRLVEELRNRFRASDIVGRIGADTFLVFMKDVAEEKDIRKQTDEFQMLIYDIKTNSGGNISANAGVAVYPDSADNAGDLLSAVRLALDKAKKEAGSRLSF